MAIENFHDEILRECAEDFCGLWDVVDIVRRSSKEDIPETIRARCLEILRDLLDRGFINAGIPNRDGQFEPWRTPVLETIDRIRTEWKQLGRRPKLGDIVWFSATLAGHRKLQEGKEPNTLEEEKNTKRGQTPFSRS